MKQENEHLRTTQKQFWSSGTGIGIGTLAVFAGFVVVSGHQTHPIQTLLYLVFGACVVVYTFRHRSDGENGNRNDSSGLRQNSLNPPYFRQLVPIRITEEKSKATKRPANRV